MTPESDAASVRARALAARFQTELGQAPEGAWAAPGRVNLIGEHTDYNEGLALPLGIQQHVLVLARRRADQRLRLLSLASGRRELTLGEIAPGQVSGWVAYGDATAGPFPARSSGQMDGEVSELREALRERGVHHAAAQYWLAYRLSFLFEEDPIVVPLDTTEDRYAPHRDAVVTAPVVAFIFHPSEPRGRPEPVETMLRQNGTPFDRVTVGRFAVLVASRAGPR